MGHFLNTFIGRADVLSGLAPSIRGLRLLGLPQGFALAPLPSMLGDAVTVDRGPLDEWRELEHDNGESALCPELAALAAAASRRGPVGWLNSQWMGGAGPGNAIALWREGRSIPVDRTQEMLVALGVVCDPADGRGRGAANVDAWDALGLGDHRYTQTAWSRALPVGEPGASASQRVLLDELHGRLGSRARSLPASDLGELSDHRLMAAWLFETSFVPLVAGDCRVWAFTARHGGGLGAFFPLDPSEYGDYEARNVTLDPKDAELLRGGGWRLRWRCWEAFWPDATLALDGIRALERVGSAA